MSDDIQFRLDGIDPQTLGLRLAEARKARGLTQEQVAEYLGCSRPTYIALEKGERLAKTEEILRLAGYFGRSVHQLVRPGEPVIELQPHLRAVAQRMKTGGDEQELAQAIGAFQQLAEDYRELERLTAAPLRTNYPPEVPLSTRIDVTELAEGVALQERQRLGLGDQPVVNLRSTLEWDVGLRIFYWPLPSALAGMYAYATDPGCCILINRKHPAVRRRVSLLHEYGHLIADRHKPGIDYLSISGRKPANERFAEGFALSFLMPASSVRHRFHEIVTTTGDFQVANLCRLSHFYFVSVEAMTLRLEGLGLIPKGTLNHLKESKFAATKAARLLELAPYSETDDPYPERYKFLAVDAYEQEKISEGQLARFLRCDPVEARRIVTECLTSTDVSADGQWKTLHLEEFEQSLLPDAS
jgi:Zn-dependent peptidase ImmA (M78 family)/transcriptional regulator with XRE-family HTH domain